MSDLIINDFADEGCHMFRIENVDVLADYRLWLQFNNGTTGEVDLSSLAGRGVFAAWDDPETFAKVRIGPFGELVWPEDIELCPDALYLQVTGREPKEIFPNLETADLYA